MQAGNTTFNSKAWSSDHRGLYIDLNIHGLIYNKLYDLPSPTPRLLTSNNRKAIKKFLNIIDKHEIVDKILTDCGHLKQISKWDMANTIQLESIDQQVTKLLLDSEQELSSNSSTQWSPKMHTAFLAYTYWRKYNSSKKIELNSTSN